MTDPMTGRYFEDYMVGLEQEVGSVSLSEAEMIDFASKYDPQDFHVDSEKAAMGPFGGLVASGWHTAAVVMRLLVDRYLNGASSLGSPGLDELRWLAPVRPGDVLTVHARVLEARRSNSKPDRGLIHTRIETLNQDGVTVMTMTAVTVVACREQKGPEK
jgi:acyl dehydratase